MDPDQDTSPFTLPDAIVPPLEAEPHPTLRGKVVLVTGSTDGIGRVTAVALARRGATVLVHGRDEARGRAVLDDVRAAGDGGGELYLADLSVLGEVRRLAAEVGRAHPRLDVLIDNAGTYAAERTVTPNGLELTFAVNVAAPFMLCRLLLPALCAAAPSRIVNLSSASHWTGEMSWDDLMGERDYDALRAYDMSKLAMTLLTYELADRLRGSGVTVVCLDPGDVDTKLLAAGWPELPGIDLASGAATSVFLGSTPDVQRFHGTYFERGRPVQSSQASRDVHARRRLWLAVERRCGVPAWEGC